MKATEAIKLLKDNSVFWSKLGFFHDPPRFDKNGKMIVFGDDFEKFGKFHRDFTNSGINIHTSILFSGWTGVDKYDYELTDQVLDAVFRNNPDIWYIPRIKLNVPLDWGKENPEDICVYYDGPRDREEICKLVNTDKHDILGYEAPNGYYTAGAWNDDRPNVGGLISNQSFSSKKWLADAGETLHRFIQHLEDGPYSKRILAYQIAYGVSGETCLWGRFGNPVKFGDYGVNNRRAFFDWGMQHYESLASLRKAWDNPNLDRKNTEPPSPQRRLAVSTLRKFFRANDRVCIDYDLFMSEVNATAVEHFSKMIKDHTGKPAGCFYGYFMECYNAAYTGWLAYERLLNSPYVDFIAAPKSYYRSIPGEPGGELAPAQSINRKKLWMDELDNRTHLCSTTKKQCANFSETRTVMWREFAKNLAHGSGFWWMDLGGGWFDSPEIMQEVATIEKTATKLKAGPGKSIVEILLVADEESMYYHSCSPHLHQAIMKDTVRNVNLCGAPVDMYRLNDLESLDLEQYKLIIFLNTFKLIPETWGRIKRRIPIHTTLLWHYAPGIRNPAFALDNIKTITGFEVREKAACPSLELLPEPGSFLGGSASLKPENPEDSIDYPLLEIASEPNQVLARYSDGGCAVASKRHNGHNIIYSVLPFFSPEHLRRIAVTAGCHMYAPVDCTIYGDSRFIAVFPRTDIDGKLHLKELTDFIDMETGECFKQTNTIPLKLNTKHHRFFVKVVKFRKSEQEHISGKMAN